VTEDSRNHMRGYGSFPEGAEPTEEIAALGDSTAELPTSRSSARPSIPSQPPTPAAARPSHPWSAPPPAFARSSVPYAEPMTSAPMTSAPMTSAPMTSVPMTSAEPPAGVSSPVRRPLYGGGRRATVEPPGDVRPLVIEPPSGPRRATVEPPGDVRPLIIEPPSGPRRATVEPPGLVDAALGQPVGMRPVTIESAAVGQPDPWQDEPAVPRAEAPRVAGEPDNEYPVWPASMEQPEGHQPAPPPARPSTPPWDPAATGWPDEPPADAGSRPEAAAEEYGYPASALPSPFFAPTRSNPDEEWAPEAAHAPGSDAAHAPGSDAPHAPGSDAAHAPGSDATHAPGSDAAQAPSSGWSPDEAPAPNIWSPDEAQAPNNTWSPHEAHAPSANWPPRGAHTPSGDWSHEAASRPVPATHDRSHVEDPHGLPTTSSRRITPTPPDPPPTRLVAGLLIGLLAGLLLFGTAGWFTGRATAPEPTPPKPATPTKQALGLFEQTQATLNAAHFKGPNLAQPWLPYLSNCATVTPVQADGEKARVRCTVDGMSAFFVEYQSTAARDKARGKLQPQVREASTLTPGAKTPGKTADGNYVEYAYRLTEGGVTRTVAGIWWDDVRRPVAAYLLAYWQDGLGERWEPMRDLWSRYA
jgi:hypothetical protein